MTWTQAGNISAVLTEVGEFGGDVTGTTRDDLTVAGIQGTAVDADDLEVGRGYVYNGTELVAVSSPYRVISDAGVTLVSTAAATTLLAGSAYTIPAGSLAVGDTFEIVAFGGGVHTEGSNRQFSIAARFGSNVIGLIQSANIATGSIIGWEYQCRVRVNTIGAAATVDLSGKLAINLNFVQTVSQNLQTGGGGAAIGNSSSTIALDVYGTLSTSSANLSLSTESVYATYCRRS